MDGIRSWAFSVCAASICGAVLNIILPEGSTQKIFKTVFCVFFLCCVISPLLKMNLFKDAVFSDISAEYGGDENFEESLYGSSAEMFQNEIKAKTRAVLKDAGVDFYDIYVGVNILKEGGIEINGFSISTNSDIPAEIKERIGNETGLIPEVKILGESF